MKKHGWSSIISCNAVQTLTTQLLVSVTFYPSVCLLFDVAKVAAVMALGRRVTIVPIVFGFYILMRFPVDSMKTEVTTERVKNIKFVSSWRISRVFANFLRSSLIISYLFVCSAF